MPAAKELTIDSASAIAPAAEKVVIQFGDSMIKGFVDAPVGRSIEDLLRNAPKSAPESFRVHRLDSDEVEDISTTNAKAIFFVNSFDGDSHHNPLQFHLKAPIIHGIWVRVEFRDGEVVEGIVQNSVHYLLDPGFFIIPTDPGSNNRLIYALKSWIKDYRVLGMRNI